ncbi:MAG: hypothetical protein JSU73_11325 [candidate division WOR-3 bacterium]|nr:MAG: hypothetical protein JSU73_11325 [candidate division WOR-3 bacterium]
MHRTISGLALAAFAAAGLLVAAGCGSAAADSLDREQIARTPTDHYVPPLVCEEIVATAERPDWTLDEIVSTAKKPTPTPIENNMKTPWPYETEVVGRYPVLPTAAN